MKKEVAKKIVRGITDKIECNTVDIDDWAEFWGFTREEYEDFLDMAIKALDQQPCEDCISREELINEMKLGYFGKDLQEVKNDPCVVDAMIDWAIRAVKRQPSVTQQPCEEENPMCTECRYYDHEKHHCPRFCRVIENTVAEITSEQTRWIPISDKPQEGTYLITGQYGKYRYVDISTFDGEDATDIMSWDSYSDEYKMNKREHKVIAYMPLPEPYKAESEGEDDSKEVD